MSAWDVKRKDPYTARGVLRLKCIRCGAPAIHQWQICSDGNNYRGLCLDCDIDLNQLVLEWMRHPRAPELIAAYAASATERANL